MATKSRTYRLRVHDAGTTTPIDGTVDFTLNDLAELPPFGGQIIDPTTGSAGSPVWRFKVADIAAIITSNLADASGNMDVLGRLTEFQDNTDAAGWATVAVGRLIALSEETPGLWVIDVSDERWQERQAQFFDVVGDTCQLYPPGPRRPFRAYRSTQAEQATVKVLGTASGNRVLLNVHSDWAGNNLIVDYIRADVVEEPDPQRTDTGNFKHVRLWANGDTEYEIVKFGPDVNGSTVAEDLQVSDRAYGNFRVWVLDPGTTLGAVDTEYTDGALMAPTAPPSETLPLLVGQHDDAIPTGYTGNVWNLLHKINTLAGVRMDETQWTLLRSGSVYGYPHLQWRITAKPDRDWAQWQESHVYGPEQVVPFLDDTGQISPRSVRLPSDDPAADDYLDVNTAFEFDSTNIATAPTFEHAVREVVNAIVANYEYHTPVWYSAFSSSSNLSSGGRPLPGTGIPADRVTVDKRTNPPLEHSTVSTLGRRERTYDLSGYSPKGEGRDTSGFFIDLGITGAFSGGFALDAALRGLELNLFERWGWGPIRGTFTSFRWAADGSGRTPEDDVFPGQFVKLTVETWPNPANNARTGTRLVQILAKQPTADGIVWDFVDAGPSLQPVGGAAVVVSQTAGNERHSVDIAVSGLPAGALARVDVAVGAGAPYSQIFTDKGNGTFSVAALPSGTLIRARAQANDTARIRSAWSAEGSTTTATLTTPSTTTATVEGWSIQFEFVNNATGYGVMPVIRTTTGPGPWVNDLRAPLPTDSASYTFHTGVGSTSYDVGVKAVDQYGGESVIAFLTRVTAVSARALIAPRRVQVTQGRGDTEVDLPPQELWAGIGLELHWHPTELHASTLIEVAQDVGFTTIEVEVQAGPGEQRTQVYLAALDDIERFARLRHRRQGFDDSPYSEIVTALPTALLANNPPDSFASGSAGLSLTVAGELELNLDHEGDPDTDRAYWEIDFAPTEGVYPTVDETDFFKERGTDLPYHSTVDDPGNPGFPYVPVPGQLIHLTARFWNARKGFGQTTLVKYFVPTEGLTLGLSPTVDETTMELSCAVHTSQDLLSVRILGDNAGYPTLAAVQGATAINLATDQRSLTPAEVGVLATLSEANPAGFVAALGYTETNGGGIETKLFRAEGRIAAIPDRFINGPKIKIDAIIAEHILAASVTANELSRDSQSWSTNMEIHGTADDKVSWWGPGGIGSTGTITFANGTSHTLNAVTDSVLADFAYRWVYWDLSTPNDLQITTTYTNAVGADKRMLATVKKGNFGDNPATVVPAIGMLGLQVGAQDIAINSMEASHIRALAITTDKLAANSVTAAKIAAAQIKAIHIEADAVTAAAIGANQISANEIAANTITTAELAAGTLSASNIEAGTITASVIIATTSFTAATATFDGRVTVEAGTGAARIQLDPGTGSFGQVYGPNGLEINSGGGANVIIGAAGNVEISTNDIYISGGVNSGSLTSTGKYVGIKVNDGGVVTRWLLLYS